MTRPPVTRPPVTRPLAALLDLADTRGDVLPGGPRGPAGERAFGGAVVARSLAAAAATVDADRTVHSLHAYFLRPGDDAAAIDLRVTRTRDGGSYTTRQVAAEQAGRPILVLTASFTRAASGPEHQVPALEATAPESLPPPADALADAPAAARGWLDWLDRWHPFDFRFDGPVPPVAAARGEAAAPCQRFWFRSRETLPDAPPAHAVALAYASDMLLLVTAVAPHPPAVGGSGLVTASLDHAVWFHGPARADDWLFCEQESTWAAGGRAMCSARVFDRAGRLVLTVAQEGMVRTAR